MQVIPERYVLKCVQWEIGDKIVEQHCSLSLSRSAVGWALECAGRVRWYLCPGFAPSVPHSVRPVLHHFSFFKLSQLCPKALSLRQ